MKRINRNRFWSYLSMRPVTTISLTSIAVWMLLLHPSASAVETHINATTGTGDLGTQVSPNGHDYQITGGTLSGNNLFHSFRDFSIGTGDTAKFVNGGNASISNILTRVTGGNSSEIYGAIDTMDFTGANFYLLNPAGVIFGQGASLKVDGSFHVSTADYLTFKDDNRFYSEASTNNPNATFSSAVPSAFGFLSDSSGLVKVNNVQLTPQPLSEFEIVSGEVSIVNGGVVMDGGAIKVTANTLELKDGGIFDTSTLGIKDAGQITVDAKSVTITGMNQGFLQSQMRAGVIGSDAQAGPINISADTLTVDGGLISTSAFFESGTAGNINLTLLSDLEIVNGGTIGATNVSAHRGGNIIVKAEDIVIEGTGSNINSVVTGEGDAGDIQIETTNLNLSNGGQISAANEGGSGNAGGIIIKAENLNLEDKGQISASSNGSGKSGSIILDIHDAFTMNKESRVSVTTTTANAGSILVEGGYLLRMNNQSKIETSVAGGNGNGGAIIIDRNLIALDSGSHILANANKGNGGDITINSSREPLLFIGFRENVDAQANDVLGGINGNVEINAPDTDIISGILPLSNSFLAASTLLVEPCSARINEKFSSFIVSPGRGISQGPDSLLSGFISIPVDKSTSNSADKTQGFFDINKEPNDKRPTIECDKK